MAKPQSTPAHAPKDDADDTSPKRLRLPATLRDRVLLGISLLALVVVILFTVPYTRYGVLGQIFKRPVAIEVLDSRTHKPVSDALIELGGKKFKTDAKGKVNAAQVPVGGWQLAVNKKYYNLLRTDIMVPLFGQAKLHKLELVAIGNQVTLKITNKITGKPISKAKIAALGTTAITDANGETVIVLPIKRTSEPGTVKLPGYNDLAINIQNTEAPTAANTFAVTPSGKLYFLSKRTGKINVMKSDLDGANASVVLAGTGSEDDTDTVLLATRDWKYLALKAKRDSDRAKLYIINTATDKLDTMDEGKASFVPVGWSGHHFVFTVARDDIPYWQPKQTALKAYDAEKDTLATLDQTEAEGTDTNYYVAQNIANVYLIDNAVVYTKQWNGGYYSAPLYAGKKISIFSIPLSGGSRTPLKDFDAKSSLSIGAALYKPKEPLFQLSDYGANPSSFSFFELDNGKVAAASGITTDTFNKFYPTYIQSPSGKRTFWYEPRDGKNSLFSGDSDGTGSKELASLSEFTPYGWYGDDYVLVSKNKSELYIAPKDMSTAPLKVADYHKPNFNGNGYGGGYGGF
jgi:hypothetical protein